MEEIKSFLKMRKVALIISAIYVGIGTLAVCSIYGSDPLYGEWSFNALVHFQLHFLALFTDMPKLIIYCLFS